MKHKETTNATSQNYMLSDHSPGSRDRQELSSEREQNERGTPWRGRKASACGRAWWRGRLASKNSSEHCQMNDERENQVND
jgi:hypothetical protein